MNLEYAGNTIMEGFGFDFDSFTISVTVKEDGFLVRKPDQYPYLMILTY